MIFIAWNRDKREKKNEKEDDFCQLFVVSSKNLNRSHLKRQQPIELKIVPVIELVSLYILVWFAILSRSIFDNRQSNFQFSFSTILTDIDEKKIDRYDESFIILQLISVLSERNHPLSVDFECVTSMRQRYVFTQLLVWSQ